MKRIEQLGETYKDGMDAFDAYKRTLVRFFDKFIGEFASVLEAPASLFKIVRPDKRNSPTGLCFHSREDELFDAIVDEGNGNWAIALELSIPSRGRPPFALTLEFLIESKEDGYELTIRNQDTTKFISSNEPIQLREFCHELFEMIQHRLRMPKV